jgi:hypothetical protein
MPRHIIVDGSDLIPTSDLATGTASATTILAGDRTWQSLSGMGIAPNTPSYVTLGTDAGLTNERVLTGTANQITLTDAGAGSTITVSIATGYVGQTSITTLGTITTGTWNGAVLGYAYGGTGQSSWSKGDLLYASATNTLSKLAGGTGNQILRMAASLPPSIPAWASLSTMSIPKGTGTSTYVTVWTGTNTQSGYSTFTYTSGTGMQIAEQVGVGVAPNSDYKIYAYRASSANTGWQNIRSDLWLDGAISGTYPAALQNEVKLNMGANACSWVAGAFSRIRYYLTGATTYSAGLVNELWKESGSSSAIAEMSATYSRIYNRSGSSGTNTTSNCYVAWYLDDSGSSVATTYYQGFVSNAAHPGSGTINALWHFMANDVSGGGTVTAQYGVYINALSGATNNYAVYLNGSGTGNGIFLNAGTAILYSPASTFLQTNCPMIMGGQLRLKVLTVATLPGAPVQGDTAIVTDSNTAVYNATVAGGGANIVEVFYNGTNWKVT